MSGPTHQHGPPARPVDDSGTGQEGHGGHSGWLMLACCIPMIVAVVLIVIGG